MNLSTARDCITIPATSLGLLLLASIEVLRRVTSLSASIPERVVAAVETSKGEN